METQLPDPSKPGWIRQGLAFLREMKAWWITSLLVALAFLLAFAWIADRGSVPGLFYRVF